MDTYNENLQVTVNDTLDAMENQIIADDSSENAAEFTLYYAQGARITAEKTLADIMLEYAQGAKVGQQGVDNYNVASNLLISANTASTTLTLATTNVATAATNVETAANSVALVAANMGAVFNLVSAEDYGTDIYTWSEYANALIRSAAYDAEVTSRDAMDASALTARTTLGTVTTKATSTQTAVSDLNAATGAQFQTLSESMAAAAEALATASEAEKAAEGVLMDEYVGTFADQLTYDEANAKLNFQLENSDLTFESFEASFTGLNNPFEGLILRGVNTSEPPGSVLVDSVVDNYYLMVVKQDKANLFELAQAEALIGDDRKAYPIKATSGGTDTLYSLEVCIDEMIPGSKPGEEELKFLDIDGDKIEVGQPYVTFVMAEYSPEYKKLVNNYNDFLSVASLPFTLTYQLGSATNITVDAANSRVSFTTPATIITGEEIASIRGYRVMFLPKDIKATTDLMTEPELMALGEYVNQAIDDEIAAVNKEIEMKELEVEKHKADIASHKTQIAAVQAKIDSAEEDGLTKGELNKLLKELKGLEEAIEKIIKFLQDVEAAIAKLVEYLEELYRSKVQPAFFWNQSIAEQVTSANYLEVDPVADAGKEVFVDYKEGVTDNFGALIGVNEKFIPVVLSVPDVGDVDKSKYSYGISDYAKQKPYVLFTTPEDGDGE